MAFRELFLPLEDGDILVPGERVYYRRRRHLAELIQPMLEYVAATVVFSWMLVDVPALRDSLLVTGVAVVSVVIFARRLFHLDWKTPRSLAAVAAFAFLVYATEANAPAIGVVIIVGLACRVGVRFVRWRWFRRIFITDRRVIEVDGLLGSKVASMPLTRVTDALLVRSVVAEVLGYGEFRVESAGQNQALARINFLDDPDRFHMLMVQLAANSQPLMPHERDYAEPPRIFDQNAV